MPSVRYAKDALNEVESFMYAAINHIESAYEELEKVDVSDVDGVKDAIDLALNELHYAIKELNG